MQKKSVKKTNISSSTQSGGSQKGTLRIDPTDWYVGMKNPKLQLMVYGQGIRDAEFSLDYPGATVDSIVRLDSPDYLLLYLDLKGAQAGEMQLNFKLGKKTRQVAYQLKQREMAGKDRRGFSNADVLYMLMPDRFASATAAGIEPSPIPAKSSKSTNQRPVPGDCVAGFTVNRAEPSLRHGGNLEGIRQHLDYFTDLGVTALWFTPVLENLSPDNGNQSTYHGYATTDYYRVDPRFGTNDDYRRLTDEAHQKGLKIVMDMIFNHCGFDHPWVANMPSRDWFNTPEWLSPEAQATVIGASVAEQTNGQSVMGTPPVNDKYLQTSYKLTPVRDPYASKIDLKETTEGWFVPSMPDLNQRNPHVMRYLIQNSFWWIETVGIDGIRMDTYPYAFEEGMSQWMHELLQEYPNFNVVGETWVTEPAYTASWQKDFAFASPSSLSSTSPSSSSLSTVLGASVAEPSALASPSSPKGEGSKYSQDEEKGDKQNISLPSPFGEGSGVRLNSNLPTVMDFSFYDKINQAKREDTDAWWNGLNRVYNSLVYDYLYPNPSYVMAFLDNHDTDRFLPNPVASSGKLSAADSLQIKGLKQGLALLLTINRTPQLYYGTEILMAGNKQITDGNVRKDFPGGWEGDPHNAFTKEGRTPAENNMFNWLSKLLHWRQGNDAIIKGKQTHWCPLDGVYVVHRSYKGRNVLLVLNGTNKPATYQATRYAEAVPENTTAREVTSGRRYNISENINLSPRQTLILEY